MGGGRKNQGSVEGGKGKLVYPEEGRKREEEWGRKRTYGNRAEKQLKREESRVSVGVKTAA